MIQDLLKAHKENQLFSKLKIAVYGPTAAANEVF
jgi:hypothetical protein